VEPGAVPAKPITLKWTNFRFEDGDNHAREAGAAVGKQAWTKALASFNGTAT
jgi:hypothetical protein